MQILQRLDRRGRFAEHRSRELRTRLPLLRSAVPSSARHTRTRLSRSSVHGRDLPVTGVRPDRRRCRLVTKAAMGASSEEQHTEKEDLAEADAVTSVAEADAGTAVSTEDRDFVAEGPRQTKYAVTEREPSYIASYMPSPKVLTIAKNGVLLFLGVTFLISVGKTIRKFLSPKAKRKRTVNKNRELVEDLIKYLPDRREELTEKTAWMIRMKTGFTPTEVFRKYLWFVLRERKFDQSAVDDLIALKGALQLSENDVATALKERAQRIYEKYGSLMLNTEGMTSAGIERKATCQALFRKVLYLAEHEPLLKPESEAAQELSLSEIFGATEEDKDKLRIVSLQDVDLEKLDKMIEEEDIGEH